jgi:hypothetical protein
MAKTIKYEQCPSCKSMFVYNPLLVPTLEDVGPICKACFLVWKLMHKEDKFELDPGAYSEFEACENCNEPSEKKICDNCLDSKG